MKPLRHYEQVLKIKNNHNCILRPTYKKRHTLKTVFLKQALKDE